MSTLNEKYIGEALLREEARKKLGLVLKDKSVTTSKMADSAVTEGKIADSSISTGKLQDGAVTTVKIKDRSVTFTKLSGDVVGSLTVDVSKALERYEREAQTARETADDARTTVDNAKADLEQYKGVLEESISDGKAANTASQEQTGKAKDATDIAVDINNHPPYVDSDGFYYRYDPVTKAYNKTDVNLTGKPFRIARVFKSIAAMDATDANTFNENDFILINTDDTEDDDDAKLYVVAKNASGNKAYSFLADLSGFRGFVGKTPQFSVGTTTTLEPETQASVSLASDSVDNDGNPKYKLNFGIPKGDKLLFSDLTDDDIAKLQKPANDMIAVLEATNKTVSDAETVRIGNENTREGNEDARKANEETRIANENARVEAEENRKTTFAASEKSRADIFTANEETRQTTFTTNENEREEAFNTAKTACETATESSVSQTASCRDQTALAEKATAKANQAAADIEESKTAIANAITQSAQATSDCKTATEAANTATSNANTAAGKANIQAEHPTYVGEDYYVYKWNTGTNQYDKTTIYLKGADFKYSDFTEEQLDNLAGKAPIVRNGNWWVYDRNVENPDGTKGAYKDTGSSVSADYTLTKENVEAVLTGDIKSHTHSQYLTKDEAKAEFDKLVITTKDAFPNEGDAGKLYIATDVRRIYFWDAGSSAYVQIGITYSVK